MAYPSIAPPRERDQVLMEIFHSLDLSQKTMLSLSRCQVSLESILLSDIATADSRYLEDFVFSSGGRAGHLCSGFHAKFQRGKIGIDGLISGIPSQQPETNSRSPLATGSIPHITWKWFYREDSNDLLRVEGTKMFHYKPAAGFRLTQSKRTYHMSYEEPLSLAMDHVLPILVTGVSVQRVTKLSIGPALVTTTDTRTGFWEFLHSWGGTWMWEVIEPGKDTPIDVSWIVEGLQDRSLI
jgi:hypothetical protein